MVLTAQSCSIGRRKVPESICLPKIPHGLTGDRTQFIAMGIRRLTDRAVAWLENVELSRINNSYFSYRKIQQDATVYQNLLFRIYMKLNMLRETHCPFSGA
jgi:hypothetical protein